MSVKEPKPGDIFGGHYVIEKELGRGGFGVVFQARHTTINRIVAVKVLLATYAKKDPTAVERFHREATLAASLSYPNAVRVFDYGETDAGVFYLTMEFISGRPLQDVIRTEGSLPLPRAVHITRQVLYALTEAHSEGFVHRDIKPENIMVLPLLYDPDFVKVMDFGIAKMTDAEEAITKAGITLGTPRYMPVEQLKGDALAPATDLYAVGLVLYEMLVGTPAFTAKSAVDVAIEVMRGPPVTVPAEAGLPTAFVQLIERACAKDPRDRYQSAGAFIDALNQAFEADPQTAPRAPDDDGGRTLVLPSRDAAGDAFAEAETLALAVLSPNEGAAVTTEFHAPDRAPVTPPSPTTTPRPEGSHKLLVGLSGATLLLVLVLLIRVFAG